MDPGAHFLAMASVVSYSPPWWVNLLHRLPHFNLRFEQTSSDFQPEDWTYQQVKYLPELPASCKLFDSAVIWVGPRLIHVYGLDFIHPLPSRHLLIRVTICVMLWLKRVAPASPDADQLPL